MCRFESPSFAQLLYDPQGSRLTGHVAVQNFPPVVADDEETVQNSKGQSRHSEEVHGSDCFTMVAKKYQPTPEWIRVAGRPLHPARNGLVLSSPRGNLILENLALRQQLLALHSKRPRPRLGRLD